MRKCKHYGWKKELLGWDDGDVYIYHEARGNFSIKRHPELHRKLVELAIQYLEKHEAKSEEELEQEGYIKYLCANCGCLNLLKPEDVAAKNAKCKQCGSKSLKEWRSRVGHR